MKVLELIANSKAASFDLLNSLSQTNNFSLHVLFDHHHRLLSSNSIVPPRQINSMQTIAITITAIAAELF